MGIAALWVVMYHFDLKVGVLEWLTRAGYGGVDVFLFLSGFGLTAGYKKRSVAIFYLRRFLRLYPTFLVFLLISLAVGERHGLRNVLIESTGISYFHAMDGVEEADWYIAFMFVLYIIFPLWMWLNDVAMDKLGKMRGNIVCTIVAVAVGLLISGNMVMGQRGPMTILAATRVPIFFIGSLFGFLYVRKQELAQNWTRSLMLLALLAYAWLVYLIFTNEFRYLWVTGLFWFPFIVITPGLTMAAAWVFDKLPKWFNAGIGFVGSISLELYLLHCFLLPHYRRFCTSFDEQFPGLSFCVFVLAMIFVSWIFHLIMQFATKWLSAKVK